MAAPWEQYQQAKKPWEEYQQQEVPPQVAETPEAGPWTQYQQAPQQAQQPEPKPEEQSILRSVADVPLQFEKGVVSGIRLLADAFGANSSISKSLQTAENHIAGLMSAQSKQDSAEISRIMADAENKGIGEQVLAGLKAFTVAPVDMVANALGTSAPAIAAGALTVITGGGAAAGLAAAAGTGMAMGAGTVKGTIYQTVNDELVKAGMPKEEADKRAMAAQEYTGKNADMIALGTGLGALDAILGVEAPIAKGIVSKFTKKGVEEAAKLSAKAAAKKAAETVKVAERGMIKQGIRTGVEEMLPEGLQAGQEQLSGNIAAQREGLAVPTMRGVASQATLEAMAGLGVGVPTGAVEARAAKAELEAAKPPPKPKAKEMPENLPGGVPGIERLTLSPEERLTRIRQRADDLISSTGMEDQDALDIAATQVDKELEAAEQKAPTVATSNRLQELVIEYIDRGDSPDTALLNAQNQLAQETADAAAGDGASRPAQVEQRATEPSVPVVGEPDTGTPTKGAGVVEPTGMVPPAGDVGQLDVGAGVQPADVAKGADVGTQTPETVQAETQGQEQRQEQATNVVDLAAKRKEKQELADEEKMQADLASIVASEAAGPVQDVAKKLQGHRMLMTRAAKAIDAFREAEAAGVVTGSPMWVNALEGTLREYEQATADMDAAARGELDGRTLELRTEHLTSEQGLADLQNLISEVEGQVATKEAEQAPDVTSTDVAETETAMASPEVQQSIAATTEKISKKRGRPAAVLTEEERTAKAEERKATQADLQALKRDVDAADAAIVEASTGLDEVAALPEAERNRELNLRREKLQGAVNRLYSLHQRNKGRKQGNRARDILKNSGIPQEMLDEAKRQHDDVTAAAAERGVDLSRSEVRNTRERLMGMGPVDQKVASAKNAQQLLSHIISSVKNPIIKLIAQRLRPFVAGVKIVVIEKGDPLPTQLQKHIDSWDHPDGEPRASGLMVADVETGKDRTIYLRGESFGSAQGVNTITALHEVLHAALDHKLKVAWNAAMKGVKDIDARSMEFLNDITQLMEDVQEYFLDMQELGITPAAVNQVVRSTARTDANGNVELGIFTDPWEFLAYSLSDGTMMSFLKQLPGVQQRSAFGRFVDMVRKVLGLAPGETNALTSLIDVSDRVLRSRQTWSMKTVYKGLGASAQEALRTQAEIDKDVAQAESKVDKSRSNQELAEGSNILQNLRDPRRLANSLHLAVSGLPMHVKRFVLKAFTLDALASSAKDAGLGRVEEAANLIQRMHGMTSQLIEAGSDTIGNVYRAIVADPSLRRKLEKLAYMSTIAQIDPSVDKRSKRMNELWDALGERGQQEYVRLREYYENISALYTKLLDDQVKSLDLSASDKTNLLTKLKTVYEPADQIKPYFPLVRRGDYWLSVGTGNNREFYMFQKRSEREAVLKQVAKQKNMSVEQLLTDKEVGIGNSIAELRKATMGSSKLLRDLFDAIDKMDMGKKPAEAREALKDSVYQLYLHTMPDQSLRRQFINRKNITGFSTDLMRDFSESAVNNAYQLSRIKYAGQIRRTAEMASRAAENNEQLMPYAEELTARVNDELPGGSTPSNISKTMDRVATFANRAAYIHYLSGASSALLQPLQLFSVGLNVLGAKYGYAKSMGELMKMAAVWNQFGVHKQNADGTTSLTMPSIRYSKNIELNEEERRALKRILGTGVADITLNNEIVSRKDMPTEKYGTKWDKVKRGALIATTGLMHTTERISREMMVLAAYRLARGKGMSVDEAIDQAVADTYDGLGNMAPSNRPSIMRNPGGKVALQFMMFPLYMSMFLVKNFKRMLPLLNKEGKAEAAKMFFGTLGATWVLAGAVGLPGFSTAMGLIGYAMNNIGEDDDDMPEDLKSMDYETWWRKVWLPSVLGDMSIGGAKLSDLIERGALNAATGLDLSSRLSLNDMFVRDRKEYRTTKEGAISLGVERAGPFVNQVLGYMDAYDAFTQGDYQKAIEKSMPALVRNLVLMDKYAKEGAKDFRGAEILTRDEYTIGKLLGQAVGFRSDKLANTQQLGFKLNAIEQRINFEKSHLLDRVNRTVMRGDSAGLDAAFEDIIKFNRKYPLYAVDPESIMQSVSKRAEQRAMSKASVILSEKNIPMFAEALKAVE